MTLNGSKVVKFDDQIRILLLKLTALPRKAISNFYNSFEKSKIHVKSKIA